MTVDRDVINFQLSGGTSQGVSDWSICYVNDGKGTHLPSEIRKYGNTAGLVLPLRQVEAK